MVLLSLSNTVQNAIIGNDNSLPGGLIGAFALLVINYLVVRFLFRHRRLDQIFEGKPTMLIENGRIVRNALAKELLTRSELMTVLHRQGFDSVWRKSSTAFWNPAALSTSNGSYRRRTRLSTTQL